MLQTIALTLVNQERVIEHQLPAVMWDSLTPEVQNRYLDRARAMLEAIQAPCPLTVQAGTDAIADIYFEPSEDDQLHAVTAYKAMIKQMLVRYNYEGFTPL